MKYSENEATEASDQDEELVERVLPLLPEIGKLLYAAVSRHPAASGLSLVQIKAIGLLASRGRCTIGQIAEGIAASMPTAS